MMMNQAFDHIAGDYDHDFTQTVTGQMARKIVLDYLDKKILNRGHLDILELNCGTGEDAICFYRKGNTVWATDISSEMISVAKEKAGFIDNGLLTFSQLSFAELPKKWMTGKFDLVFSNFGGLNCINKEDLAKLFQAIKIILKPGGRFIGVIMPRFCFWEIVYFTLTGKWKKVFRRKSKGPVSVNVGGSDVSTWYYSPGSIRKMTGEFELIAIRPVGLFLPPSFLEKYFQRKKRLLGFLRIIDQIFARSSVCSGLSDHFLFDLKRQKPEFIFKLNSDENHQG